MRSRRRVRNGSGACRPRRRSYSGDVADVADLNDFANMTAPPPPPFLDCYNDVDVDDDDDDNDDNDNDDDDNDDDDNDDDNVAVENQIVAFIRIPSGNLFGLGDAGDEDASNANDSDGDRSPSSTEALMEVPTDSPQALLRPSIHRRRRFTSRHFAGLDSLGPHDLDSGDDGQPPTTSPWACDIDNDEFLSVPRRRMTSMSSAKEHDASAAIDSEDSDTDSLSPKSMASPKSTAQPKSSVGIRRRRLPSLDCTDGEESDDGNATETSSAKETDATLEASTLKEASVQGGRTMLVVDHDSSSSPVFHQVVVYGAFLVADMFQAIATTKREVVSPWLVCVMAVVAAMFTAPFVRPMAELLRGFGGTSALVYCGLRVLLNTWDTHQSSSDESSIVGILVGRGLAATASNLLFLTIMNGTSVNAAKDNHSISGLKAISPSSETTPEGDDERPMWGLLPQLSSFTAFRLNYLIVHGAIMLADGLQGTHLYVLYEGYGYSVASLYSLGFLSGAITSPFIGPLVDRMGRKKAAMLYCALEVIINLMEQFPVFAGLIASRVIGGITTNLLFSVFESWLVSEHRRRGFAEDKIEVLLRDSVIVSNLAAIVSGYVAHWLASWLGPVGPFEGAVTSTAVALVLVATMWRENFGTSNGESVQSVHSYLTGALKTIVSDSKIARIGLVQGLTEGSLQTFVFLWSPALRRFAESAPPTALGLDSDGQPAYGLIFGAFMACGVLGGLSEPLARHWVSAIFAPTGKKSTNDSKRTEQEEHMNPAAVELLTVLCYLSCAGLLCVPYLMEAENACSFSLSLGAFLMYEFLVGLYMPCEGVVRSIYMPNDSMCSLMTMLRVIVNVAVAVGVISTNYITFESAFAATTLMMMTSASIQLSFISKKDLLRLVSRSIDTTLSKAAIPVY